MCIQGVSGERDICGAVSVYVCSSVAFSMSLTVTRVGCRVVLSVMEENVQQYKGKLSFLSIIIFAEYHYYNICCFEPGYICFLYRQFVSTSTSHLHFPPPSIPSPLQTL